jgi:hypothetical protein
MNISKELASTVSKEIQQAVTDILKKHNLVVSKTSVGCGEWFDYKVTATALEEGPNGVNLSSKEAQYYTKFGYTSYDEEFQPTVLTAPLGTLFTVSKRVFAFGGINPKKKNCILGIEVLTGRATAEYYFGETVVRVINGSVLNPPVKTSEVKK